jgi:hypothetical protein
MSFARLQKVKRILERYPKTTARESAKDREYQQYLDSLSIEELKALYNAHLEEYSNSPEWIAKQKRLEGMTVEQLMAEIQEVLKAS